VAYPKIVYVDQFAATQTLQMNLPPTKKPYSWLEREGSDSYSTAGIQQAITLRVDEFFEINLENVEQGDEIAAWDSFMRWMLFYNGEFDYFPDSDIDTSMRCTIDDKKFKPEFDKRRYKFKLTFRKVVP
jgi:hypothetical protein